MNSGFTNNHSHGGFGHMFREYKQFSAFLILLWLAVLSLPAASPVSHSEIKRLTYSGNNVVEYPCLSDDGRLVLYIVEIKNDQESLKSVRMMNVDSGKETELFRSGTMTAPAPFEEIPLMVGSKPPVLSGNGQIAIFSLTLGEPKNILDHYLAVVNTDGSGFKIVSFPIDALKDRDLEPLDFESAEWERISNYAIDRKGTRAACLVKGHLGPRRYGNPSGIIFLDIPDLKQRTILAPGFIGSEWVWPSFPRRPLLGGGWSFCLSGDGEKLVFGAQSSEEKTDYDLYYTDWEGKVLKRLTDFHDRWFSLADIDVEGKQVVFYYNGNKKQGMGTYIINSDGTGLEYLESKVAPRIELFELSGNGRFILFKHVYKGMILDLQTGKEAVAFDENTPGYAKGLFPMDFPRLPAFWRPRIMSLKGNRILLIGPPQGKETPEIYMLRLSME
jgi:hypothetical protein